MGFSAEQFESLMAGFQVLHRPRNRRGGNDTVSVGEASGGIGSRRGEGRASERRRLRQKFQAGPENYTTGEEVVSWSLSSADTPLCSQHTHAELWGACACVLPQSHHQHECSSGVVHESRPHTVVSLAPPMPSHFPTPG